MCACSRTRASWSRQFPAPPDAATGSAVLVGRSRVIGAPVRAVIESMTGARFVHDTLEQLGWDVVIADAQKVKGLAPLACKTDKIDARVLAVLSHRDLVPAIWLPDPRVRSEREHARFRLHLVKHKSMLKHRIHSTLIASATRARSPTCSELRGPQAARAPPDSRAVAPNVDASLELIDYLERQIDADQPRAAAPAAPIIRYVPLLLTVPGIGWVLAFTIASEIGDITRFPIGQEARGYTGLCPRVHQSGESRPPRPADQAGPQLPALGDARGHHARAHATPPTQSATSATRSAWASSAARASPRSTSPASSPRRSGTCSPTTSLSTPLAAGRRHFSSGRLTALLELRPRSRPPMSPGPPRGGDREMSAASPTRSTKLTDGGPTAFGARAAQLRR